MTTLKERLTAEMKAAMKSKQKDRLGTIRMVQAAIKKREIDDKIELDDAAVLAVIEKQLKQCRDAHQQFVDAGRDDLATKEASDIAVLEDFMPTPFTDAEIDALIDESIAASGAAAPSDMGKVMKELKPRLQGRADMGKVSGLVKGKLSS